jgi:hypothetical protein
VDEILNISIGMQLHNYLEGRRQWRSKLWFITFGDEGKLAPAEKGEQHVESC